MGWRSGVRYGVVVEDASKETEAVWRMETSCFARNTSALIYYTTRGLYAYNSFYTPVLAARAVAQPHHLTTESPIARAM